MRNEQLALKAKMTLFVERIKIEGSKPVIKPGESVSMAELERAAKGFEFVTGPGKDLIDAVARFEAACRKMLE